jgi:hypothetical protein
VTRAKPRTRWRNSSRPARSSVIAVAANLRHTILYWLKYWVRSRNQMGFASFVGEVMTWLTRVLLICSVTIFQLRLLRGILT